MRKYTLHIFQDAEETSRAAAEAVLAVAEETIAARDRFCVALSGGSTPKRLYQLLTGPLLRKQVDWSKAEIFWCDERPVPPDHPDSNYGMAREVLLQPLAIPDSRIHRMQAEQFDRAAVAEDYQNEIARVLGITTVGEPPALDLVLLGLGADAHTASLFPATSALLETRRWVVANRVIKLDSERLTMTAMLINRAAHIFFLVAGEDKATALAEVLEGPIDTQRLPAQLIRPAQGKLVWFVDQAAASKLTRQGKE
jgi:6-phosphogluconolactonase